MKKFHAIAAAAVIAVGLGALGLFIKAGMDNFSFRDRVVTVRGLAEKEVEANLVIWPISYTLVGNDLQTLYNQVSHYNDVITRFLTGNDISTEEISVNPPDIYNSDGNRYGGSAPAYKYTVNGNITVSTSKIAKVRELLNRQAELLKEGIAFSNSYISYQFTELNSVKPEMIAEATRNAREAADRFAADSDSKVGKIKTATQGQFSIDDRDSNTPYIKKVRVVSTIVYYLED